jgi:hypothetical protein
VMDDWKLNPLSVPLSSLIGAVNAVGSVAHRAGISLVPLDKQALLEEARRKTGLDDFGEPDLQEPFGVLLGALQNEARLHLTGRLSARFDLLRLLCNRLLLERDWKQNPGIENEQIVRPLFITGLPRSGTTLLHNLLAQDPMNRFPAHWQVMYPSPPPAWSRYGLERRIARVQRQFRWFNLVTPEFKAIHWITAESPQECTEIPAHVFSSLRFDTLYEIPSYVRWLSQHGFHEAYAFHRRFLQHLQWRRQPRRWVLKSPDHVFSLDELLIAYPDAGIIMTHRDPLKVLPSVASLTVVLQSCFRDSVNPAWVGSVQSRQWAKGADRIMDARKAGGGQERFLDVHYLDLVRDPVAAVRRIYHHFDIPLTDDALLRMRRFLTDHPKNRHGNHRYSLEQFNLNPEAERRQYQSYMEYFGIESESL